MHRLPRAPWLLLPLVASACGGVFDAGLGLGTDAGAEHSSSGSSGSSSSGGEASGDSGDVGPSSDGGAKDSGSRDSPPSQGDSSLPDSSSQQDSSFPDSAPVDSSVPMDAGAHDSGIGLDAGTADDSGCNCQVGQVCDQFSQCIDPTIIDDFVACVPQIPSVGGRAGTWYSYNSADVGLTFGVAVPPGPDWSDTACGAWAIGGATTVTSTDYAGIGVTLNNTSTYSFAGHNGLLVEIETSNAVWVQLKLLDGDYFHESVASTTGAHTYSVPFSGMTVAPGTPSTAVLDLTQVTDVQLTPSSLTSFGYDVHLLAIY